MKMPDKLTAQFVKYDKEHSGMFTDPDEPISAREVFNSSRIS